MAFFHTNLDEAAGSFANARARNSKESQPKSPSSSRATPFYVSIGSQLLSHLIFRVVVLVMLATGGSLTVYTQLVPEGDRSFLDFITPTGVMDKIGSSVQEKYRKVAELITDQSDGGDYQPRVDQVRRDKLVDDVKSGYQDWMHRQEKRMREGRPVQPDNYLVCDAFGCRETTQRPTGPNITWMN